MRIAVVTHKLVKGSGQGRVNYEVAQAAARRGHEVVLLASEVAPALTALPSVTWVRIPVEGWPTALLRGLVFGWYSTRWLRTHRSALDLVLSNGCITGAPADINAVHFVHSAWRRSSVHVARVRSGPYAWYQWLYSALNAYWEQQAFRKAGVIVAVSEQVRDELIEIDVPAKKIRVVHNGVHLEEFAPGQADRRALGLPSDVPLALFAGDISTPRKNLDTLLKALREVPRLHVGVAASTRGSTYPQMARRLGLEERVHFLGFRRDVPQLMRAADLFAFPSRYEACSLVLLEALASGLPVVTAHTAGGAELVTEEAGIVLPDPDDHRALADVLRALTEDSERRCRMSRAARAIAEEHSWDTMAQQYLHLMEQTAPIS